MKKNLFSTLFFFFFIISNSQTVNIPDINFKNYLLGNLSINTNDDNEIQLFEAQNYTGIINCVQKNINSLEGIEAFTQIRELYCGQNNLTTLDVSQNTALQILSFPNNKISNIDISQNTSLMSLACHFNNLTSLDTSQNIELKSVYCFTNNITSLDFSKNINLNSLNCNNNNLSSLNIRNFNNNSLSLMYAGGNTNLLCIQVDSVNNSNSNVTNGTWSKDSIASFNTTCNMLSTVDEERRANQIYPNPTKSIINFSYSENVELYNTNGQKMGDWQNVKSIDLSTFTIGNYILILKDKYGNIIKKSKIIKK